MKKRFTRQEKKEIQRTKLENNMSGTGIYIYENNTDGDLNLPKPTISGSRTIGPRKRFQGDSYYMKWVGSPMNLLRFIEEVVPQTKTLNENKENNMNEKKLILDQPDTVTSKGKVEHVVSEDTPVQSLNDSTNSDKKPDVLLNESPIEGLEIILG
jgi:hypothetical protein